MRRVSIFGATGSIGVQSLHVVEQLPDALRDLARQFDVAPVKGKSEPLVVYDLAWQPQGLTVIARLGFVPEWARPADSARARTSPVCSWATTAAPCISDRAGTPSESRFTPADRDSSVARCTAGSRSRASCPTACSRIRRAADAHAQTSRR